MRGVTMQEYIAQYKVKYAAIGTVYCGAMKAHISFTMVGFKHLIFKGGRRRPNKVIKSRVKLLPLAVPVLKKATGVLETRFKKEEHGGCQCEVRYDALDAIVSRNTIRVRVIVRTVGTKGVPHFFSIMRY